MLSSSARCRLLLQTATRRSFRSRAHPKPTPEHTVSQAVQMVLDGVEERKVKRQEKWEHNASKRAEKGITVRENGVIMRFVCFYLLTHLAHFS